MAKTYTQNHQKRWVASLLRKREKSRKFTFSQPNPLLPAGPGPFGEAVGKAGGDAACDLYSGSKGGKVKAAKAWMIYTPNMIIHGTIVYLPTFVLMIMGICW